MHAAFASLLNSAAREPRLLASVAPRLATILLHHSLRTTEHLMACTMFTFLPAENIHLCRHIAVSLYARGREEPTSTLPCLHSPV